MKPSKIYCLVFAMLLPLVASAQSVRTLSYNSSNNVVIGATNSTNALTFSNAFAWSTNTLAAATRTNLALPWLGLTNTNANGFRLDLSLSAAWLTNTNVTNFRTAIGLGVSNNPTFSGIYIGNQNQGAIYVPTNYAVIEITAPLWIGDRGSDDVFQFESGEADKQKARENLGLGLAALTNTSNVTAMRALAGSTNINEPYSGTVAITNTNAVLVFSNGILKSVQ